MGRKTIATALMALGILAGLTGTASAAEPASASTHETVSPMAVWYTHSYHEASYECDQTGHELVSAGLVKAYTCTPDSPYPQKPWRLRVLD